MRNVYDFEIEDFEEYLDSYGLKPFRARQIFSWLYKKRVDDFDAMTDLGKDFRNQLKKDFKFYHFEVVERQVAQDATIKYLFELADGHHIETVLMHNDYGKTVCVTSQVGCNMGCKFCASGLLKKQRDLTAGEMVMQILHVQKELDAQDERVSNIVVMGIGEPFDNYENVMKFMNIVNSDLGLAIGARKITVSTCGIPDKIRQFADDETQYNLAISLHAASDEVRSQIMPVNQAYPLKELFSALDYYAKKSNRRLTFEYILLKGINDDEESAEKLADLVRNRNAYVNLIPYNSVDENEFKSTEDRDALLFYDMLKKRGVNATLRQKHGDDIDAACGQLRAKVEGDSYASCRYQ